MAPAADHGEGRCVALILAVFRAAGVWAEGRPYSLCVHHAVEDSFPSCHHSEAGPVLTVHNVRSLTIRGAIQFYDFRKSSSAVTGSLAPKMTQVQTVVGLGGEVCVREAAGGCEATQDPSPRAV